MKKINVTVNIPTSKEDILLEDWIEFDKINEPNVDQDFLQKRMLEIFCDVPTEYSLKLKQVDVDEILLKLNDVIVGSGKANIQEKFTFNGKKYGLIPDFGDHITTEELILADKYIESKDYARLLSILYRPITFESNELYQIEPFDKTHTDFLKLGYHILEGVLSFFLRLYEKLVIASLKYTLKAVEKSKILDSTYQEKLNSLLNGVDIQS